jgi:leucyl aminopeptidase
MKISTTNKDTHDNKVVLVHDCSEGKLIEALIKSKDLNVEVAGSTYLHATELEGTLRKNLYVTSGALSSLGQSGDNIAKIASSIISYMKTGENGNILLDVSNLPHNKGVFVNLMTHLVMSAYKFSLQNEEDEFKVDVLVQDATHNDEALSWIKEGVAIGEGVNYTKHLGDLPSNICTPNFLAESATKMFAHTKVTVESFGEYQASDLGMGGFLSVSKGSDEEGQVIILTYDGGKAGEKPIVLVGKAVTFDSGGISLKPSSSMEEMKYDMCGGATVLGTIKAAAALGIKKNIVGIIGAVENMPSGNATKPGDIITMMSGKTVEVTNTDAEGRMVLADLLTYVGENYDAHTVIDFATLTGACVSALGSHAAGVFSDQDVLANSIIEAGEVVNDRCWRLPMWDSYNKDMDSDFADVGNSGKKGAGASTAACFLNRFASEYDYQYAHVDIAGVAWSKFATGRPVRMAVQFLSKPQY